MPGTILIPQINASLNDQRFLALFNDISNLSDEVLWYFKDTLLQLHRNKFDNNLRKPDAPRYEVLQDLTSFFIYAQTHTPHYPSGGYYELLVEWIDATPEIFGHTQEMRFQYAVQTWYSVFTQHAQGFALDHNTLLILAAHLIAQPARFTALIGYMLANQVDITTLMESQVLQDFFAHYAEELSQEGNPIACFYNTFLAISKAATQPIPTINATLIDMIDDILFDIVDTYAESEIPQLIALTQTFPQNHTKLTWRSIRPSHLHLSIKQLMNYYRCFGLHWIIPALSSVLSHHKVDEFLKIAVSPVAAPSTPTPTSQAYNRILSYLVQQAFTMDIARSAILMGRLALTLKSTENQVFIERYPELLFLLVLNPKFLFSSNNFLYTSRVASARVFNAWPEHILAALKKALPIGSSFTNSRLYS
ncbi:MAG: hypothetical protein Q8R79_09400, partial [Legionellaceae bacterium]|nr:hypothetical protein [Legionellaceae bacterium]